MRTMSMALAMGLLVLHSPVEAQTCKTGAGSEQGCSCCAKSTAGDRQTARPMGRCGQATTAKTSEASPGPARGDASGSGPAATESIRPAKAAERPAPAATKPAPPERRVSAGPGMTAGDHEAIRTLVSRHRSITRVVGEIPGGVRTTTTTDRPELVGVLRTHVRQMALRLEDGRPIRLWDPVFRDVFAHADEITLKWKDIEGGIEVTETSENPRVVPMIRAHARKVNDFVAGGHAAVRPPWAGGRGR